MRKERCNGDKRKNEYDSTYIIFDVKRIVNFLYFKRNDTLELPNNKTIEKNYEIINGEVDIDYLEELCGVHLSE